MEGAHSRLVAELKTLRKGRGLFVGQLAERVGPALRSVCGISDADPPAEIRRKVTVRLVELSGELPADLYVALMAAFGIDPDARLPFYQDRVRWAAEKIRRDDQTARRRIDEGIERIAELAVASPTAPDVFQSEDGSGEGWHTAELRISCALDQAMPEAFEFRRVVADRDNLTRLDLAVTVTASPDRSHRVDDGALAIDVFHGGTLIRKERESTDRFGVVLALPEPLRADQRHDIAMRYRFPPGHVFPHLVCVPKYRCDLFELWVRFHPRRRPAQVWKLAGAFQRDVDDPVTPGQRMSVNSAGDVQVAFRQLTPGRAYGIRWTSESPTGIQTH